MQKGRESDLTLSPTEPLQWEALEATNFHSLVPVHNKHQLLFIQKLEYDAEKARSDCGERGYAAANRIKRSLLSRTPYLSCRKLAFYLQRCLEEVHPQDQHLGSREAAWRQRSGPSARIGARHLLFDLSLHREGGRVKRLLRPEPCNVDLMRSL